MYEPSLLEILTTYGFLVSKPEILSLSSLLCEGVILRFEYLCDFSHIFMWRGEKSLGFTINHSKFDINLSFLENV